MHSDTDKIINLIYETAEDIALWPQLLDDVSGALLDDTEHEPPFQTHIDRALRVNQRLTKLQEKVGDANNMLEYLPMAIVTISDNCHIEKQNSLARKIIDNSHLLAVNNGRLSIQAHTSHVSLSELIAAALCEKPSSNCATKLIEPISQEVLSIYAVKADTTHDDGSHTLCTLFIVSNFLGLYVDTSALRSTYGLTPAEARLAQQLVNGDALTAIAEKLGLAHNTVRNQLKSIFSKTGTKRQAELVGLILSTPANLSTVNNKTPACVQPAAHAPTKKSLTLNDGSTLDYYDIGDPQGRVMLYLHEFFAWDWWNIIGEDVVTATGIRMIAPLRPGYAGTHLLPNHSFSRWSTQIASLLDHLKVDDCVSLGFSSGGPFAAAAAFYLSDRCTSLALVNSTAPVSQLSQLETIRPAMSKLVVGFAKYSPKIYQRFFQGLLRSVNAKPASYIRDYMQHWSEFDAQLVTEPIVLQNLIQRFEECLANGGRGILQEAIVVTQDWGFNLSDIQTPTSVWIGEDDRALPSNMKSHLEAIPNSQIHIIPKAGHMIMLRYWREIFDSVLPSP